MDVTEFEPAMTGEEWAALVQAHRPKPRPPSLLEEALASGRPVRFATVAEPIYLHYAELIRLGLWERRGPAWQVYARELPRLLAEGREGQYVLIAPDGAVTPHESWQVGRRAEAAGGGVLIRVSEHHPFNRIAPLIRLCTDSNSAPTPTASSSICSSESPPRSLPT